MFALDCSLSPANKLPETFSTVKHFNQFLFFMCATCIYNVSTKKEENIFGRSSHRAAQTSSDEQLSVTWFQELESVYKCYSL